MAEKFGVVGTVKYSPDHKVIVEASGSDIALNKLIAYCRLGCFGAEVENISIIETNNLHLHSFNIQFDDKLNETQKK